MSVSPEIDLSQFELAPRKARLAIIDKGITCRLILKDWEDTEEIDQAIRNKRKRAPKKKAVVCPPVNVAAEESRTQDLLYLQGS